jgi:hypothetical protein
MIAKKKKLCVVMAEEYGVENRYMFQHQFDETVSVSLSTVLHYAFIL